MKEERRNSLIFFLILIFGIFFPTSIGGVTLNQLYYLAITVLLILYLFFIKKDISKEAIITLFVINFCLFVFSITAASVFSEFSFGIYPNFLLLGLLFFLDLKTISVDSTIEVSFLLCTVIIIAMGIGVVFQSPFILDLIKDYYIASYENLVPNMLALRKPVGPFATHSVSSLFIFLFFYLNVKSYKTLNNGFYLFNAIVLLILLFFIRSNTSLLYLAISLFVLFDLFKTRKVSLYFTLLIGGAILIYVVSADSALNSIIDTFDLSQILGSDKNGVMGRYSTESPLKPTIDYILTNPLSPVGLTVSDKLYYSDSGFILYILRGSIILALAIYIGFYKFIRRNILDSRDSWAILLIILLFEVGYPILINLKMLFFIPFLIVYLNYLLIEKSAKS